MSKLLCIINIPLIFSDPSDQLFNLIKANANFFIFFDQNRQSSKGGAAVT
jgi:hypothetical protein